MGNVLQRRTEKKSEVPSWGLACSAIRFLDEDSHISPCSFLSPCIFFVSCITYSPRISVFRSFYRTGKVLHSTYVYQKTTLP